MVDPSDKILILALGNEVLMDESIPIRILKDLQASLQISNIDYRTLASGGINLMEAIDGYQIVILIDSIKTPSGVPGTVYYYTPGNFMESFNLSSTHDLSFQQALDLGNIMGFRIPPSIHVLAVEILENQILGEGLSHLLAEKYGTILNSCKDYVLKILADG